MSENAHNEAAQPQDGAEDVASADDVAEASGEVDGRADLDVEEPGMIRFVGLAVPIVVLVVLFFVVRSTVDFAALLPDFFDPPMAEFTGRVFYNDEPLNGASIEAKPMQKGRRFAIAFSEPDGRFQMMTDIDGKYVKKVFVGDYQLKLAAHGQSQGASPPPRLTPAKYDSYDDSGLKIQVKEDAQANTIEIRMVD